MARTAPASLSIYRGQSRKGIGEGPGRPIAHGEQYLDASSDLAQDNHLLDAVRIWMSLDSDPADHQRLRDELEAWSCFCHGKYQLVVRLASAGMYNQRAAYFSHGRAWSLEAPPCPGFDPGLYIGCSEAFDNPWRLDENGKRIDERGERAKNEFPSLVRPQQIAAEPQVAARLLAHLFHCVLRKRSLILSSPIAEFAAGKPLHALISFAHGSLPADLKPDCRVRIYTRLPELFLRQPGAILVAVPEDSAEKAFSARREAILLDRQGNVLAGDPPDPAALSYAEAVIERAVRIPDGLGFFSERFQARRSRPGLPEEREVQAVQITYNLAVALAGSEEERGDLLGDLLRSYLPRAAQKLGPDADWKRLITLEEWKIFPQDALQDFLLLDAKALSAGARQLQQSVESVAGRLGLKVDPRLSAWWDSGDPTKRRRLLELAVARPPLVSRKAVEERVRDSDWVRAYVVGAPDSDLVDVARLLLQVPGFCDRRGPWADAPELLLNRIGRLDRMPAALTPFIQQAGLALDSIPNLAVYLRLAELLSRADESHQDPGESALITKLWEELPRLDDRAARDLLVRVALSPEWRCLQPRSLVHAGALRASWLEEWADLLIQQDEVVEALDTVALLGLGAGLRDEVSWRRLFERVDALMLQNPEPTVDALISTGWWPAWRSWGSESRLDPDVYCRAAARWMTSPAWPNAQRAATLEDWKQVMADLPRSLSGIDMQGLCRSAGTARRTWPWIPLFEEDQLLDLVHRAADLGALAELAEALEADDLVRSLGVPSHRYILQRSRWSRELPADALAWLLETSDDPRRAPLSLDQSLSLRTFAGHRKDRVLEARAHSVLATLNAGKTREALGAAQEPSLWSHGDFLAGLGAWMNQKGSVQSIGGGEIAAFIDQSIAGEPSSVPPQPSKKLIQELTRLGDERAARLLSPDLHREAQRAGLLENVLQALAQGRTDDSCWQVLSSEIKQNPSAGAHPLVSLAHEIRRLAPEKRRELEEHGWATFESAARSHPPLMTFPEKWLSGLPVLELAASLSPAGGVGNAALRVIFSSGSRGQARHADWWTAILRGLRGFRRYPEASSPDDRDDVALAVVIQSLDELEGVEQRVFLHAFEQETKNSPEWALPAEFGMGQR
jgi:hypothetical protein